LLGIALFIIALLVLRHVLAQYHLHDILAHMRALPPARLYAALLLTFLGYGCLTFYEALGLHFADARVPYPRLALISFMGYAIGHNVGVNTLSGGAVRYRAYSAFGLSGKQVATVIAFGTVTFSLGAAVLLGLSLLIETRLSAAVLHLHRGLVVLAGCALLAGVAGYFSLACSRHDTLRFGRLSIPVPSGRTALAQVGAACADLLCAAGVLYVLLPPNAMIGYFAFAGLFLIAIAAGILSNVPGGVGVFESVLLLLFRQVPPDQLLGSVLAYRLIYYLGPFALALGLLGGHELWLHRAPLVRMGRLARTWLGAVTPQASALAVFGAGAVLLLSGATPGLGARLAILHRMVPLPVLELSHLLGSAVGVGLLVLANGLYRRLDAAWYLTMWLLCAGVLSALLKGFDIEEAIVLGAVAVMLVLGRERFRRRASLIEQRFSGPWIIAVLLVFGAALGIVIFAYRHVPYSKELWWEFAFEAPAPRSLRAMLLALMIAAAYALWRLLRPSKPAILPPSEEDLEQAARLVRDAQDPTANLALLGDKSFLFTEGRTAFVMYQASGSSWVSMGDPVGEPVVFEELVWTFIERCDGMAVSPVFYEVTPEHLPLYIDLGLTLSKLGEEARVPLEDFSLEGPARADVRHSHRRAQRDGAQFELVPPAAVGLLIPALERVSSEWLAARNTAEKRFSLGFFQARYLEHFPCAVVRREGAIVAFANLWRARGGTELAVDLMRYSEAAPKGVIEFMLAECMLWGRAQGARWFSLGMAPLAGLEEHALAPAWHKVGRLVQRYGETFYPFEGVRKFKEKFLPVWRPRYLAAPGGIGMAGALLDVTTLISGGMSRVLAK
jgi:phosphatidylglycerol lysyltransferase